MQGSTRSMPARLRSTAAGAALALAFGAAAQEPGASIMKPGPAPGAATVRTVGWDALVPPGWDAMKDFRGTDLRALDDADPRAAQLLKQMREAWNKAPVNMALMGQAVRIAGYVVPLEETREGLKEFLLVPTYGACIHTPPPPSNQIIHVVPRTPVRDVPAMSVVAIAGVLQYMRNDSAMGSSSWRMDATTVALQSEARATPLGGR